MMSSKVRDVAMPALITMMLLGFANVPGSSQAVTADMTGRWSIQGQHDGHVRLQLEPTEKRKGRASIHLALTQFQGLTKEQLFSNASDVNFRLVREAGTLTFSGSFHEGAGTGQWTFKADPAFVSQLRKHGYEQPANEELYALAVSDVGASYIADLESEGYKNLPIRELVALRSNGVTADDARVLQELISGDIPAQQLIALKSNDVSMPYIKSLGDAGYKQLTAAQLLALRTNGVTREFIERLEKSGQKNLTVERLVSLRINAPD